MARATTTVPILTYHSISEEAGPTSLPETAFRAQMEALAELDVDVVGLDRIARWLKGDVALSRRTVAITFDDAFRDFADAAFPILDRLGFPSCVFAPTLVIGGVENWRGSNTPPRALLDWSAVRDLSNAGVEFGSHTRTHCDLTTLSAKELDDELSVSRRELEDQLQKPAPHFAPPYGRSNPGVRDAIARHYELSLGVRLGEADAASPPFDVPRIEMHYFRDINRWRSFLMGEDQLYFHARRAARGLRESAQRFAATAAS